MSDHLPEHLADLADGWGDECWDHNLNESKRGKLRAILTAAQAVTSLYSGGAGADINSSTGNSYMDDLLQSLLEALADD